MIHYKYFDEVYRLILTSWPLLFYIINTRNWINISTDMSHNMGLFSGLVHYIETLRHDLLFSFWSPSTQIEKRTQLEGASVGDKRRPYSRDTGRDWKMFCCLPQFILHRSRAVPLLISLLLMTDGHLVELFIDNDNNTYLLYGTIALKELWPPSNEGFLIWFNFSYILIFN